MKLGELLNKFLNGAFISGDFILTVNGLCNELSCTEIVDLLEESYFKLGFRDKKVKHLCILSTNMTPELIVEVEDDEDSFARRNYFR